jgi:hypothetical protein
MAEKTKRILNEYNYLLRNQHIFDSLTKREKELLKFFALGNTNEAISKELFISVETVATHRKNIKRKLGCKSNYDCTYFAQVFNNTDEIISLFQEVRASAQFNYSGYFTGMKVLLRNNKGNPKLLIAMAIPVSLMSPKISRPLFDKYLTLKLSALNIIIIPGK